MIDDSTRLQMAQTMCLGATLLQQVGGNVHLGPFYTFSPDALHISASDLDSLRLWAGATNAEIQEHPHEDTIQHRFEGKAYGHPVHGSWIQKLFKPLDVTGWTDEEIQHQHDLDIEAGATA